MDRSDRTSHHLDSSDPGTEMAQCAAQADDAIRRLARLTVNQPALTPADIDTILGHLADSVAALPQIATQLAQILERSGETHRLSMDLMTATARPELAIDTARLHLEALRRPARETYRHLNAARNETAHISATPHHDVTEVERAVATPEPPVRYRPPRTVNRVPSRASNHTDKAASDRAQTMPPATASSPSSSSRPAPHSGPHRPRPAATSSRAMPDQTQGAAGTSSSSHSDEPSARPPTIPDSPNRQHPATGDGAMTQTQPTADDTAHRDLLTPAQLAERWHVVRVTSPISATRVKASATSRSAAASPTDSATSWPSRTSTTSRSAEFPQVPGAGPRFRIDRRVEPDYYSPQMLQGALSKPAAVGRQAWEPVAHNSHRGTSVTSRRVATRP